MRCAIFGCSHNNQNKNRDKNIRFHCFPKDSIISKLWVIACCRAGNFNTQTARICSVHFVEGDYERNLQNELLNITPKKGLKLKHSAVPSVLLPKTKKITAAQSARDERTKKKNSSRMVQEILNESIISMNGCNGAETNVNNDVSKPKVSKFRSIGMNTEKTEDIGVLKRRIKQLEYQNHLLTKIFTPAQVKKLIKPLNNVRWSVEDISEGKSIFSAGPRAYRLLLNKGYPLPAESTLRNLTAHRKSLQEI